VKFEITGCKVRTLLRVKSRIIILASFTLFIGNKATKQFLVDLQYVLYV
jgi:hypothetical protein